MHCYSLADIMPRFLKEDEKNKDYSLGRIEQYLFQAICLDKACISYI
ncbi:hypothetical protein [Acinetobacter sp. UBA6720]|nr:hypothetical protein [Acinetobacter sp. UBA6720]